MAPSMNELILQAAGRTAGSTDPRLSAAQQAWERTKDLPDDSEAKMLAAFQLEKAVKAVQDAERPRNPDGTFASFDGGVRGIRRSFPRSSSQESANALFARALTTSAQETRERRDDPGVTVIAP
jgi:hypothetical protein